MRKSIRLSELNGSQLSQAKIVFLPLGSTEFHGMHAPTGTDSIIAEKIAEEVATRVKGLVLPTLSYGYSALHVDHPGTVTVSAEALTRYLLDILCSLGQQKVKRVMLINGHDGNIPGMTIAAAEARRLYPDLLVFATTWWEITRHDPVVANLFGDYGGKGHGGAEEMAIVMAAGIGAVDVENAEKAEMITHNSVGNPAPFLRNDLVVFFRDIREITGVGYEGDPREATREKGDVVLDIVVTRIVDFVEEMESTGW